MSLSKKTITTTCSCIHILGSCIMCLVGSESQYSGPPLIKTPIPANNSGGRLVRLASHTFTVLAAEESVFFLEGCPL